MFHAYRQLGRVGNHDEANNLFFPIFRKRLKIHENSVTNWTALYV